MFTIFVVFIILKLTNVIDWSWWLVVLPLLLPYAFILFMLVAGCVTEVLNKIVEKIWTK